MCITRGYNISKMEGVSLADATQDLITLRTRSLSLDSRPGRNSIITIIILIILYGYFCYIFSQGRRRRGN